MADRAKMLRLTRELRRMIQDDPDIDMVAGVYPEAVLRQLESHLTNPLIRLTPVKIDREDGGF